MAWAGGISWAFSVCAHCVWWTQITPLPASVGSAGASAEQLVCAGATARLLMDWNELWNPQHMKTSLKLSLKTSLKLSLDKVWGWKKKKKTFAWEVISVITPRDAFLAFFYDYLLPATVGNIVLDRRTLWSEVALQNMSSRCNSQDLRAATQLKNRPVKIPQSHSLLVLI